MLEPYENERLAELCERFKTVAKRRHKMEPESRRAKLEYAAHEITVFAEHLLRKYDASAFQAVIEIADFLRNPEKGAPKYIDIALNPQPPETRVPFVPAEYIKRQCARGAQDVTHLALASFE